ncbi:hypothetical protein AMTRI_Chr05g62820 [Amborella trichopoda]
MANLVILMSCSSLRFSLDVTWMSPSLLTTATPLVLKFDALLPLSVIFKSTNALAFGENHKLKAFSTYILCHRLCTIAYTSCIRRLYISHYKMPIYRYLQLLRNYP